MALPATARRRKPLTGSPKPRIGPPRPLKTRAAALRAEAACIGIEFMPWQDTAALYLEAVGPQGDWLYAEVPVIVGRQNGKTEILVPHICRRIRMGRRVMHTAQNRELPRDVFGRVADHMLDKHKTELASKPRFANGQEEIRLRNGGRYRIFAPTRGGARGPSNDDLIVDEIREMVDHDFIAAAKPALSASTNPQTVYLSNAGTEDSVVLNALRKRAQEGDRSLAYLEWSAAPEMASDDRKGWIAANPAIGFLPHKLENLEREYQANLLGGTMEIFEVEHLCRWQASMDARLVRDDQWDAQEFGDVGAPRQRSVMAIKMDPSGERASAVVAWQDVDGRICLDVHDTKGGPIEDRDALGRDLQRIATANRVWTTVFDPYTDADLARHLRAAVPMRGPEYALASEKFVNLVTERRLRVNDPQGIIRADLAHTVRYSPASGGGWFKAVRSSADQSNTAAEAAVMAAWKASRPLPIGQARIN